jgi:hypothetical protein
MIRFWSIPPNLAAGRFLLGASTIQWPKSYGPRLFRHHDHA